MPNQAPTTFSADELADAFKMGAGELLASILRNLPRITEITDGSTWVSATVIDELATSLEKGKNDA